MHFYLAFVQVNVALKNVYCRRAEFLFPSEFHRFRLVGLAVYHGALKTVSLEDVVFRHAEGSSPEFATVRFSGITI